MMINPLSAEGAGNAEDDQGMQEQAAPSEATPAADATKPPCKEFRIKVQKSAGTGLGLELDLVDGKLGLVRGIKPGVIETYNSTNDEKLEVYDFIAEVNGNSKDVIKMFGQVADQNIVDMVIRRATPFKVSVKRKEVDGLGATLAMANQGDTLLLKEVHEVFMQWNRLNPGLEVKTGDRVLEVNTERGDATKLKEKLTAESELDLDILILSPSS